MAEFNLAFKKMLGHEGGYNNDPDDLGKETYKGISRANHKNWQGWSQIDKYKGNSDFPAILDADARLQKEIEDFYRRNFWSPLNADQISNQAIAASIFDFSVNVGIVTGVRLIQSIVGTKADGLIGEQTLKRINTLDFGYVQAAFTLAKINHYKAIVKKHPTNKKYFYGWVIRALEFND